MRREEDKKRTKRERKEEKRTKRERKEEKRRKRGEGRGETGGKDKDGMVTGRERKV